MVPLLFLTLKQKNMKKFFAFVITLEIFFGKISFEQNTFPATGSAGIGTTTPNASSILEVKSTTLGVLFPRMTKTQRDAITTPAEGLLIYQTNSTPGLYYYEGSWTAVTPKAANKSLSNLTAPTAVNVNLIPATDSATNLGGSSLRWKNIYLANKLFIGGSAFLDNSGSQNTLIGNTGNTANTGSSNTVIGNGAFTSNSSGSDNTANGAGALFTNTSGYDNTANGAGSLGYNKDGHDNTADGLFALLLNTSGFDNTADGDNAGSNVTTGWNNTFIGVAANCGTLGTLTNSTAIGNLAFVNASNNFVFGNSDVVGWGFGVEAGSRAIKVGSTSSNGNGAYLTTGGVWTDISDRSKKENITELDKNAVLEKILQLKITQWKYIGTKNEYHIGPMADDFHRLFEVGDDSSISSMDKTGVLFLGVQALSENQKSEAASRKLKEDSLQFAVYSLQKENAEMKNQIAQLQTSIDLSRSSRENQKSSTTDGFVRAQVSPLGGDLEGALLGQNIPNPFDNSTLIPFRIPKDCKDASIMITNTSTSEVISVIPISCNEDHVSVDAGTFSSGTYSYTLYVDGKMIETKQMILTK